jgi:hypothetical protein
MNHITLRRTKNQKVNGKKIIDLPERLDYRCMLDMDQEEQAAYEKAICMARHVVNQVKNQKVTLWITFTINRV